MEEIVDVPGHNACRIREFVRWHRLVLEHERSYLSGVLAAQAALIGQDEKNRIVHEITDIDYLLSQIPPKESS